jgi:hypothetical protein
MSPKPSIQQSMEAPIDEQSSSVKFGKAIKADAFDRFIEEQLQRDSSEENNSEFDVVCHAY